MTLVVLLTAAVGTLTTATEAAALWSAQTAPGGQGEMHARTMTPSQQPNAAANPSTSNNVEVSWAASTGGVAQGYEIRAYDADTGEPRPVGGTCAGTVTQTSCVDSGAPDGHWSYTVTGRREGWSGAESAQSTPIWVDTVAPTVQMTFPAPGGAYNEDLWNAGCPEPGMCGSADDVGSGLASGGVTLRQNSSNLYWDGTSFTSSTPVLLEVTGGSPGFNVWGFPIDNFPTDGSYTARATATDTVGNTTTVSSTFTIDRSGDISVSGFPEDGSVYNVGAWNGGCSPAGFCGSVEGTGTIVSAEISIRQDDTALYWDGSAFTSETEIFHPITDPAGFPFPIDNFPDDGGYTSLVEFVDEFNNVTSMGATFRIDRIAPVLQPIFPQPGGVYDNPTWDAGCPQPLFPGPGICGTASDDSGSMSEAHVSIRQVSTGLFWDGSAFTSTTEVFHSILVTGFLSFPAANFPADGRYAVHVAVRDQGGNPASISDFITIDNVAPNVGFTFPEDGGAYSATSWNAGCGTPGVCGTTTDATSGVASTQVSIRQDATGNYWDGTGFTSTSETFVSVVSEQDLPFPARNFPADGSYTVRAESRDFAGNLAVDQRTFTIDRVAPTLNLAFPQDGTFYSAARWDAGCSTPGICGTVAGDGDLASATVSIRQGTGNYWDGAAFASPTEVTHSFESGSLPFPITNFPADGQYTVRAVATDQVGNTTAVNRTFTIDRTGPTVTGVTLANADGLLRSGDSLSITFSESIDVRTLCSAWSGTGDQSMSNVTIDVRNTGNNDSVTAANSPSCSLAIGNLSTHNNYVVAPTTFAQSTATWTASTRTLQFTFGTLATGTLNSQVQSPSNASYSLSTAITDRAGNPLTTTSLSLPNRTF